MVKEENIIDKENLKTYVHKALKKWHVVNGDPEGLFENLTVIKSHRKKVGGVLNKINLRVYTNQVLTECMEMLAQKDKLSATILEKRFIENKTITAVSFELNLSPDQLNRRQRAAIEKLTELVYFKEIVLREEKVSDLLSRLLPQTSSVLFGFDNHIEEIVGRVLSPGDARVLIITGIGGIGKTCLTDAVVREVVKTLYFEDFVWIRAESFIFKAKDSIDDSDVRVFIEKLAGFILQNDLPPREIELALKQKLTSRPYLVVIDNLESEIDASKLYEYISDFTGTSKFIITSRKRPPIKFGFYCFELQELSRRDSGKLLINHAKRIGLENYSKEISRSIKDIFTVTGGNPLALKLVVGLLDALPLPVVLQDLRLSQPGDVEEMYRFIYWKSWRALGDSSRALLQAMPLISPEGGVLEQLAEVSGLNDTDLKLAIKELFNRSLLERRGTLNKRRYGIHNLTKTFLLTEIVNWPFDN